MKVLFVGATLLFASALVAQQEAHPPYGPPPHETPAPVPGQAPSQMPPDTHAPPAVPLSSSEVQQQIQQKLGDEPGLAGATVRVNVDDHSVTLTGDVDTEQQHELALRIAQSYAGDRPIDDKIQIRGKA